MNASGAAPELRENAWDVYRKAINNAATLLLANNNNNNVRLLQLQPERYNRTNICHAGQHWYNRTQSKCIQQTYIIQGLARHEYLKQPYTGTHRTALGSPQCRNSINTNRNNEHARIPNSGQTHKGKYLQIHHCPTLFRRHRDSNPGPLAPQSRNHSTICTPPNYLHTPDRAFSAAPRTWNRLPTELKLLRSTDSFRHDMKTFVSFCLRAPVYRLTLMRPRSSRSGRNTSASVTVTVTVTTYMKMYCHTVKSYSIL